MSLLDILIFLIDSGPKVHKKIRITGGQVNEAQRLPDILCSFVNFTCYINF